MMWVKKWQRGWLLNTPLTRSWSGEEKQRMDSVEKTLVFSDFSSTDQGRSRKLICTVNEYNNEYERNVKLIVSAPELLECANELIKLEEKHGSPPAFASIMVKLESIVNDTK